VLGGVLDQLAGGGRQPTASCEAVEKRTGKDGKADLGASVTAASRIGPRSAVFGNS
jgi:hypothetical protein